MKLLIVVVAAFLVSSTEGFLFGSVCKTNSECYNGEGCCVRHFLGIGNTCVHKQPEGRHCLPSGTSCRTQCQKDLDCVDEKNFDLALEPHEGNGFLCMKRTSAAASTPATVVLTL